MVTWQPQEQTRYTMGKNKDTRKQKRHRMTAEELAARHQAPMLRNAFARVSASAAPNNGCVRSDLG